MKRTNSRYIKGFPTIQNDNMKYLGDFCIGHVGQGIIGEGNLTLPSHDHGNNYELTCILKGDGISYYNETPMSIHTGDIFVSFPYEYHRIEVVPNTIIRERFLTFSVRSGAFLDKISRLWINNMVPEKRIIHDEYIPLLIKQIIEERQNESLYSNDILINMMQEVILRVLRGIEPSARKALAAPFTAEELCHHVKHYVDTHLFTMNTMSEIAKALNYNYCYLATCFKKTTGQTIVEYYIEKRMQVALALVKEQTLTLTEVARTLGFSSIYAFSRAFRDYYSISPREYQKNIKTPSPGM